MMTPMGTPLNFQARTAKVADDLRLAMRTPGGDLATAALTIARIESQVARHQLDRPLGTTPAQQSTQSCDEHKVRERLA